MSQFTDTNAQPHNSSNDNEETGQNRMVFTRLIPRGGQSSVQYGRDSGIGSTFQPTSHFDPSSSLIVVPEEHSSISSPGSNRLQPNAIPTSSFQRDSTSLPTQCSTVLHNSTSDNVSSFQQTTAGYPVAHCASMDEMVNSGGTYYVYGGNEPHAKMDDSSAAGNNSYRSVVENLPSNSCLLSSSARTDFNSIEMPPQIDVSGIVIEPYDYPPEYKENQYDAVLLYSEEDEERAIKFSQILTNIKFIKLDNGKAPLVCTLDRSSTLTYVQSKFRHLEEALNRSTYMFLFVTAHFCSDSWAELQRDECLMESINNPNKKWCVVPILTKPRREADYVIPFGMRALKGVDISQMLRGKKLDDIDVDDLTLADFDPFFLRNMQKMLNDRIGLKINREKVQLKKFNEWLEKKKHEVWIERQMSKAAESSRLRQDDLNRVQFYEDLRLQKRKDEHISLAMIQNSAREREKEEREIEAKAAREAEERELRRQQEIGQVSMRVIPQPTTQDVHCNKYSMPDPSVHKLSGQASSTSVIHHHHYQQSLEPRTVINIGHSESIIIGDHNLVNPPKPSNNDEDDDDEMLNGYEIVTETDVPPVREQRPTATGRTPTTGRNVVAHNSKSTVKSLASKSANLSLHAFPTPESSSSNESRTGAMNTRSSSSGSTRSPEMDRPLTPSDSSAASTNTDGATSIQYSGTSVQKPSLAVAPMQRSQNQDSSEETFPKEPVSGLFSSNETHCKTLNVDDGETNVKQTLSISDDMQETNVKQLQSIGDTAVKYLSFDEDTSVKSVVSHDSYTEPLTQQDRESTSVKSVVSWDSYTEPPTRQHRESTSVKSVVSHVSYTEPLTQQHRENTSVKSVVSRDSYTEPLTQQHRENTSMKSVVSRDIHTEPLNPQPRVDFHSLMPAEAVVPIRGCSTESSKSSLNPNNHPSPEELGIKLVHNEREAVNEVISSTSSENPGALDAQSGCDSITYVKEIIPSEEKHHVTKSSTSPDLSSSVAGSAACGESTTSSNFKEMGARYTKNKLTEFELITVVGTSVDNPSPTEHRPSPSPGGDVRHSLATNHIKSEPNLQTVGNKKDKCVIS